MKQEPDFLNTLKPDHVFDGGNLDCGSGLILLLRENMLKVPVNGVLEMRSREASVADDLPPWCRMVGHEFIGHVHDAAYTRYYIRKKELLTNESKQLLEDKNKAKSYEWRIRNRVTGHLKSTTYCRNFSFHIGQPASFEEKDAFPSALEYFIGALAASLSTGFSNECAIGGLQVDDVEITIKCKLHNILAHLGVEEGDPSISHLEIKCFVSCMDEESKVRKIWETSIKQSPLLATLAKCTHIDIKLNII